MMSKLVDAVNYMSTWTCMITNGQGHSLIMITQIQPFLNFFYLETA